MSHDEVQALSLKLDQLINQQALMMTQAAVDHEKVQEHHKMLYEDPGLVTEVDRIKEANQTISKLLWVILVAVLPTMLYVMWVGARELLLTQ